MTVTKDLISPGQNQLQTWERNGLAYTLVGGEIVPTATHSQLSAAIVRAKGAFNSRKGPEADPAFRRHLESRCRLLGVPVPDWSGVNSQGYSGSRPGSLSGQGMHPYDGRSADAGKSLAAQLTAAGIPPGSTVIRPDGTSVVVKVERTGLRSERYPDGTTPAGRAYVEALKFQRKANEASNPADARGYRDLAKARFAEAGFPA